MDSDRFGGRPALRAGMRSRARREATPPNRGALRFPCLCG